MKEKLTTSKRKKHSNPFVRPKQGAVKKPEFKLTDDSVIVLTIFEQGRFKCYGFNNELSKSERYNRRKNARQASVAVNKKGTKKQISFFEDHVDANYFDCSNTRRLQGKYCKDFVEIENKPYNINKSTWNMYSKEQRFMAHIALIAEGKPFYVDIIN